MKIEVSSHRTTFFRISLTEGAEELGFCFLVIIRNSKGRYALLEDVFVHPPHRKKGVGTQLVRAVIEKARELGCYTVLATVNHQRSELMEWYSSAFGFIEKGSALWRDLPASEEG